MLGSRTFDGMRTELRGGLAGKGARKKEKTVLALAAKRHGIGTQKRL